MAIQIQNRGLYIGFGSISGFKNKYISLRSPIIGVRTTNRTKIDAIEGLLLLIWVCNIAITLTNEIKRAEMLAITSPSS